SADRAVLHAKGADTFSEFQLGGDEIRSELPGEISAVAGTFVVHKPSPCRHLNTGVSLGAVKGRGTPDNPVNRFESIAMASDPDIEIAPDDIPSSPKTVFLRDTSRSIISENQSPDVGIEKSVNPYR